MVVRLPEMKKYLNRDGLEEYNSLLPHSSTEIEEYVADWLDAHPEATTTVQDGSITTQKLADASVTRNKLAADVAHLLGGMMISGNAEGETVSFSDAYSEHPMTVTIYGKSTQNSSPTGDTIVPIQNIEVLNMILHASADGTLDYTNWPASIPMNSNVIKGIPLLEQRATTADRLILEYVRDSDRDGFGIYHTYIIRNTLWLDMSTIAWRYNTSYSYPFFWYQNTEIHVTGATRTLYSEKYEFAGNVNDTNFRSQNNNKKIAMITNIPSTRRISVQDFDYTNINAFKSSLEGCHILCMRENPITIEVGEAELPILPAPIGFMWSEPTTKCALQYMRDANIVISDIEQAIADQ